MTVTELQDTFDKPIHDQTKARNLDDLVRWVKDNTTLAINALEAVSYLIKSSHSEETIKRFFDVRIDGNDVGKVGEGGGGCGFKGDGSY